MTTANCIANILSDTPQRIFGEIQALKRQILPNDRVFLFGSRARGNAHEDSDWDLLVILSVLLKFMKVEAKIGN